jgi:NAD-dependent dihydropyrimidine dehydrogenase PreA subunit
MVLGLDGEYVATVIDANRCNLCMACEQECPESAVKIENK